MYWESMAVLKNLIVLCSNDSYPEQIILAFYHKGLNKIDYMLPVPEPEGTDWGHIVDSVDEILHVVWLGDYGMRIDEIDRRSGDIRQTYTIEDSDFSDMYYRFVHDGSGFWAAGGRSFDHRIARIQTGEPIQIEEHRNPIFATQGLAWDGFHCWVFDHETRCFCNLELDGL